jgi:hypothetical protein
VSKNALSWFNSIRHTIKSNGEYVLINDLCMKSDDTGNVITSIAEIIHRTSFKSQSAVKEAIKRAVENGLIFKSNRNGKCTILTLNIEAHFINTTQPETGYPTQPETGYPTQPETGPHPAGNRPAPSRKPATNNIIYTNTTPYIGKEGGFSIMDFLKNSTIDATPEEIKKHCKRVGKEKCFRLYEKTKNDPTVKSIPAVLWHKIKKSPNSQTAHGAKRIDNFHLNQPIPEEVQRQFILEPGGNQDNAVFQTSLNVSTKPETNTIQESGKKAV